MNKSVYIAKSGQQYIKTLNNFFLHVSNHTLNDIYMLNYGIINNMNSLHYSSIEVLIDFVNSVLHETFFISNYPFCTSAWSYLWSHEYSVWKLSSNCLLNPLSAFGCLMISVTWSINFQVVFLFYMSFSSLYLFSTRQLREMLAEP